MGLTDAPSSTMAREFKLPDLGEGVHEGQVMRLFVGAGDSIREDEPLMEVETDKAAVEIPSPCTGVVSRVHVEEKQVVNVGDVMFTFADGDDGSSAPAAAKTAPVAAEAASVAAAPPAAQRSGRRAPASPSVRKLARTLGVTIDAVTGSGPGGRVTRADVEAAAANPSPAPTRTVVSGTVADAAPPVHPAQSTAQPAAAAPPAAASSTTMQPLAAPITPAPLQPAPIQIEDGVEDTDAWGPIIRQPLTQARRTISRVMSDAWATVPHVTDCNDADITDLERLRKDFTDPDRPERKVRTLAFVVRAVCRALQRHPILNASIDEASGEVHFKRYVNIAIGVETARGLVAPVIRNAQTLSITAIADHLDVIASNARSATFQVNDTRGGTYTISNAGAVGATRYSTPIIIPPQVACLAVGRARLMPWVVDGEVVPRMILPLSHSIDHRLIDGGREMPFIGAVISDLEQPMRFLL